MKLMQYLVFSLVLFISGCIKVDDTIKLFFPKELSDLQKMQTDFSAFWWNFVVIDKDKSDTLQLNSLCAELRKHIGSELRLVICGASNQLPYELLNSWSADSFLRDEFKPEKTSEYIQKMNQTLISGSFASEKNFFNFLRLDPFQSWKQYQEKMIGQTQDLFEYDNGFMRIRNTNQFVIPIQFLKKPALSITKPIVDIVSNYGVNSLLVGAHGSAFRNETQVKLDLETVSVVTGIVFILFILFLIYKAGFSVIILMVPVSISVFISAKIVEYMYGDIHGLTLSFGSGIIGLALDYGLHGLLGQNSAHTWKSNFIGMLTTLCGVLILVCSGIPLIQQMMVFSSIGLIIAFIFYYILFRYASWFFKIKDFKLFIKDFKKGPILILIIFLIGIFGLFNIKLNLDLKKMSFMSDKEVEYSKLLFDKKTSDFDSISDTYMIITDLDKVDFFKKDYYNRTLSMKIPYQGIDLFLPNFDEQKINVNSWIKNGCKYLVNKMNKDQALFFKPYFDKNCKNEDFFSGQSFQTKLYLSHLVSGQFALSLLQPTTRLQSDYIEKNIPEAKSIVKSVMRFSVVLKNDLKWMIPLSLLLTILILIFYYKKINLVLLSLFPFFIGMSLFFAVSYIYNIEIDLIAILGLVMVFGFSIDYGVFATDAHYFKFDIKEIENVYTALTLAAITNALGFLPMLFATHPVLKQLGYPLFFGTIGSYIGTLYGIRNYFTKIKKYEKTSF